MRDFGLGDVAVCSRCSVALVDETAAFEVIDLARLERVRLISLLHLYADEIYARPLHAERAQPAVLWKFTRREIDLPRQPRANRVEAPDSGIKRGLRRDDRAFHPPLGDDRAEVTGLPRSMRDVRTVRPQRERALHERHRVYRAQERASAILPGNR